MQLLTSSLFILLILFQNLYATSLSLTHITLKKYEIFEDDPKKIFKKALNYFNEDQFESALPLFLELVKIDSENPAFNFYVAFCMQMLNYEVNKYLPYYEKAVVETTLDFQSKYTERRAPVVALFYLAKAYQYLYRFDEALEYYILYKNALSRSKVDVSKELKIVDKEIEKCYNAKKNVLSKIDQNEDITKKIKSDTSKVDQQTSGMVIKSDIKAIFQSHSLPGNIRFLNTKSSEISAQMISPQKIIFTSNRPDSIINKNLPEGIITNNIYYIEASGEKWSNPKLLKNINTEASEAFGSISPDGKTLYISSDFKGDDDIYVCFKKNNDKWSKPKRIGKGINTSYSETSPFITIDGQKLFFCSNRPGGIGGKDIYVCELQADGSWSKPKNLGNIINTRWDEESPFYDEENQILYFSSQAHNSLGGFDIFYSKFENGKWSQPLNIGLPVNSIYDDLNFKLPLKGNLTFYSSNRKNNPNDFDIYAIEDFDIEDFIKIDTLQKETVKIDETTSPEKLDSLLAEMKKIGAPIVYRGCILNHESKPFNATVQILEAKTNVLVAKPVPDANGKFTITLDPRKEYFLWVYAPDYILEPEILKIDLSIAQQGKTVFSYIGMNPDKRVKKATHIDSSLVIKTEITIQEDKNISLTSQEYPINKNIVADEKAPKRTSIIGKNEKESQIKEKESKKENVIQKISLKPEKGKYTIQLAASNFSFETNFTSLPEIYRSKGKDGIYRYYYGSFENKEEALLAKANLISYGITKAFVKILKDEEELTVLKKEILSDNKITPIEEKRWTVQLGAGKMRFDYFKKFSDVKVCDGKDKMRRFIVGEFMNKKEAIAMKKIAIQKGYYDAWTPLIDENRQLCHDLETIEENEKLKNKVAQAAGTVSKKLNKNPYNTQYATLNHNKKYNKNTQLCQNNKKTKNKSIFNLWGLFS